MDDKTRDLIQQTAHELLAQLQITGAGVEVSEHDETILVTIESEESGLLIGYHGRTLEALQLLMRQIVFKKTGTWIRLTMSIGDYRARREEQLKEIAEQAAEQVISEQEPLIMDELTPAERRIIHLALQNHEQVMSESEGEGRNRRLVIKLKPQA